MKPATRIYEFLFDILKFCESDSYLGEEIIKERKKFLTLTPEMYYKTSTEINWVEQRFADHFIFSYISQYYEMTPLEVFLSKRLSKYNKQDQKIFLGFKDNFFSAFSVTKVVIGFYFMAKALISGEEYKVRESKATHKLNEGDCIVSRVLPYETDYVLSNTNIVYRKESAYMLKRLWKDIPYDITRTVTPLMLERYIFQKDKSIKKEKNDFESAEKKLKHFLKKYLGRKAPSIKNLRKKINKITDPFSLMRELSGKFNFSSNDELIEFQKIFMDFWNLSSRDEFQGESPQEVNEQSMGPQERELILDLMRQIQSSINPDNFSNQEELDKAIKKCQDEWLQQPQEELDHKTPWEVISDERKRLGSPRKGFTISMTIFKINSLQI